MLRSRIVHRVHELSHQGLPVAEIARTLGISRPTVRKYREGAPPAKARQPKRSKLDPYKAQVRRWVEQDHCANCVSMLERLRPLGYTGGISQLKMFVHPLRPARAGKRPVRRYETRPGEQMQFDWGEFTYEEAGVTPRLAMKSLKPACHCKPPASSPLSPLTNTLFMRSVSTRWGTPPKYSKAAMRQRMRVGASARLVKQAKRIRE